MATSINSDDEALTAATKSDRSADRGNFAKHASEQPERERERERERESKCVCVCARVCVRACVCVCVV